MDVQEPSCLLGYGRPGTLLVYGRPGSLFMDVPVPSYLLSYGRPELRTLSYGRPELRTPELLSGRPDWVGVFSCIEDKIKSISS